MISRKKKSSSERKIREEDVASVLKRYSVTTVISMLHEISQSIGNNSARIDWEALVKKTTTGISNPKEYQMLWRHLAYGSSMPDPLLTDSRPCDDDSDLECEVEAFPSISYEASSEASAFVKVLMASGFHSEKNEAMVEAPLAFNVPLFGSEGSMLHCLNTSIPVLLQKQAMPGVATAALEQLEKNAPCEGGNKKKRKNWTKDEDVRLFKAVSKHGTGNWAAIATDAGFDRTGTQLSQRWAHIRRKNKDLGEMETECSNHLSEAQEAARHAMNLALDPPSKISLLNNNGGPAFSRITETTQHTGPVSKPKPPDTGLAGDTCQASEVVVQGKPSSVCKLQVNMEKKMGDSNGAKPVVKGKAGLNVDPVRAAAVAAGARIATPSDAASLIKAAQAKNAVHIIATGAIKQVSAVASVSISSAPVMAKATLNSGASCDAGGGGDCGQIFDVNGAKKSDVGAGVSMAMAMGTKSEGSVVKNGSCNGSAVSSDGVELGTKFGDPKV